MVSVTTPFLALLAVCISAVHAAPATNMDAKSYAFSTYTGFFKYDTAAGASLPAVATNFGLNDDKTWAELTKTLNQLNRDGAATDGSAYKLIFAGRHGQGYHNVGESQYGTPAWDAYWSKLDGDGTLVWGPDARLTPTGIQQAQAVNDAWRSMLAQSDAPPRPTKLYSSPMSRALSTLEITFKNVLLNNTQPALIPTIPGNHFHYPEHVQVKENFREVYGEHTCDMRRTKSELRKDYPEMTFERGFSETDNLWTTTRETDDHVDSRLQQALTDTWNESKFDQVLSLTSHSGVMQSLFRITGHYPTKPATGALIPLIVKGTPQY